MDKDFGVTLLKNIMQNAFQTEVFSLKVQTEWKLDIPSEIAQVLQPNSYTSDMRFQSDGRKRNECLYVTKTNLDFYMMHFFLTPGEEKDTIMIGPFRSDAVPVEGFSKKIEEHPFLSAKHRLLLTYYENLPEVSLQNIVNTAVCIISAYMMQGQNIYPVYTDFSTMINNCFEPVHTTEIITIQRIDNIDKIIGGLRGAVLKGDTKTAQAELKNFLRETELLAETDLVRCRRNLYMLHHTIFMLIYYVQTLYRLDIFKLHADVVDRIERVRTHNEAVKLASDICYDYCMLFQKNTFPEYPKQINEVINYIHLHLQEKLTLSVIAEGFRVAPSKLSASFKQSTGMTITAYIQQVRIQQAMDYLHKTVIPISEIALATGFGDFAYFSKVFKKHTGYSPTEYREQIKKDC